MNRIILILYLILSKNLDTRCIIAITKDIIRVDKFYTIVEHKDISR